MSSMACWRSGFSAASSLIDSELNGKVHQIVPRFLHAQGTHLYGVRWEFWN